MEKVPLFTSKKEVFFTFLFFLFFLCLSFGFEYYKFLQLQGRAIITLEAKIQTVGHKISKNGKPYYSYKLKSSDLTFYTTSWKNLSIQKDDRVKVEVFTKDISFFSYLQGFYAPNKSLKLIEKSVPDTLHVNIEKQHNKEIFKELYLALFVGEPYSKELREFVTNWGIAHLLAISGFHLGLLSSILYFLLRPLYRFFQDRYFPYRNSWADLAMIVFLILGLYVWYIGVVPSVLRAYVMSLFGYFIFSKNIELLSFSTLGISVCLILVFFPKLLFSIGFAFSVAGVFFIFLFLHHFKSLKNWQIFILLHFWVYILMIPLIHAFFDVFTFYQLLSPFLSMGFILFYPLSLFLHVIGYGGIFDDMLESLIQIKMQVYSLHVSYEILAFYLVTSLVAIRYRLLAFVLPFSVLLVFFI